MRVQLTPEQARFLDALRVEAEVAKLRVDTAIHALALGSGREVYELANVETGGASPHIVLADPPEEP